MATNTAPDPLKPSTSLLCKLGSLVVHAEEFLSPDGHAFDKTSFESGLQDPEVQAWLTAMSGMAMVPKKRR